MKLGSTHVSMIGVGVSAVAAIAMVLYYRNQATQAAATADTSSGMGAFPYFQTAALPASAGSSGTSTPAAPALDVNALLSGIGALQTQSEQTAATSSFSSTFGGIVGSLASQISQQLGGTTGGQGISSTPIAVAGFANPTGGGGFQFGINAIPQVTGTPNSLAWLYGSPAMTGSVFGSSPTPAANNPNSTNSTQPPATIVH